MINTAHLSFRAFRESDFEAVHDYGAHIENIFYMTFGPNTEDDTRDFIRTSIACAYENPQRKFHFAIIHKESGRLIGGCSLFTNVAGEGELGWIIHRDFWHNGYGTETGAALLELGFGKLNLHRVIAHCDTENYGSYRVMEKIGMRREGTFKEARPANKLSPKQKYSDDYLYAILRGEWEVYREIKYYNALPVTFGGFIDLPELYDGTVRLICYQKAPAEPERNFVPAYHFAVCAGSDKVGSIVIRIGYTDALYYGGQIGYEIDEPYRGKGYAVRACRLAEQIAKAHGMKKLLITNDIRNDASRRVCEKLGARWLRVAESPEGSGLYRDGQRFSNVFEWDVE